jgi:hypothetical protein
MQPGKPRCGAKVRSPRGDNTTCMAYPVKGSRRCRMHRGGKEHYGVTNPNFKNGKYAKLPARLLDTFHAAENDPELLALRQDISAVDARIADLIARVDTGESGAIWRALRQAQHDVDDARRDAQRAPDDVSRAAANARLGDALSRVRALILDGHADYAAWEQVGFAIDRRRKLVESERKRLVEMSQVITSEQALAMIRALMDAVESEVTDREQLANISRKAMSIINRQAAA